MAQPKFQFQFDLGGYQDQQRKNKLLESESERRKLDQQEELYRRLLQEGHEPDAAAYLAEKSVRTGRLATELPTYKNLLQQDDIPNRPVSLPPIDGMQRSTLKPFSPRKQDTVGVVDEEGQVTQVPIQPGTNVKRFVNKPRPPEPTVFYDSQGNKVGTAQGRPRLLPQQKPAKDEGREYDLDEANKYFASEFPSPSDVEYMAKKYTDVLGLEEGEIPTMDNPKPTGFRKKFSDYATGRKSSGGAADQGLEQKAADWLKSKGAPVTPKNIEAVIKNGKVK